ncbi:MAG TPA: hypothetical protein VMN57_11065 [Anaerolineales bacterium]|nr:hypothetical protein [Anaerolineales bacterium]
MACGVISPQEWGLAVARAGESIVPGLGESGIDLEKRMRNCVDLWLPRHFDEKEGAFHGFYRAPDHIFEPPQTVNLIAPWLSLAAYDRWQDGRYLGQAGSAADWFYRHFVVSHPMSVVIGGVRERLPDGELWTKFAAEYVLLAIGIYNRTGQDRYLAHALQSAGFLIQSARHGFAPRYGERENRWLEKGWQSFGRAVEAFLCLGQATGEERWFSAALQWGEYGLKLMAEDGGLYLIDEDYFNTDIAADELRAFVFLYERTGDPRWLNAAERSAGWLIAHQRDDGAWPLTIDRDGNTVVETVGPGDVPNIAVSFLRLHAHTGDKSILDAASGAFRYSLSTQILPGSGHPYSEDPNVQWGFWSWDPYYDYTLSGDQATHHVRGLMFALDYLLQ